MQPLSTDRSIGTEHGYLILAAMAGGSAGLLGAIDYRTDEDIDLAVYLLLATLTAIGAFGWLIRSGQARIRCDHAQIDARLQSIETLLAPRGRRQHLRAVGHTYISQAAQDTTVGIARPPVDADTVVRLPAAETLRAARSLASKVVASERRRAEDNSEDTRGMRT